METKFSHSLEDRHPDINSESPAVQCVKESYECCGKTFVDAAALRKHSHIHGEKQYVCGYKNCGEKYQQISQLRMHLLFHSHACPFEGCSKVFWFDTDLKSHMETHSQENYHICKYPDCGKRCAHKFKLKNHIAAQHEKIGSVDLNETKYNTMPSEKPTKATQPSGGVYASASSDCPFVCPYEGCEAAYIREYKLKLHLKREHPWRGGENVAENAQAIQKCRKRWG